MGLGKFLSKAAKSAGSLPKVVTKQVEHTASHAAKDAVKAGKGAISKVGEHAGKTIAAGAKTVGKVGIGKFTVANVANTATHVGIGKYNLSNASDELRKGIANVAKIPVLGSIIGVVTPIHLVNAVNNVARGQRVDRAAIQVLENKIRDYKDAAPYAASIVSFVPGIGPGVGAGIAAGAALASGKRWDEIAIEAAKGAIPGGNIAKAVFDASQAAIRGKPLDQIGIAALPIDDKAKAAIAAAIALTKDLAAGKRVDQSLLNRVEDLTAIAGVKGKAAQAISSGARLTKDLASGKRVDQALLARAGDAANLAGVQGKAGQLVNAGVKTAQGLASGQNVQQTLMARVDDALKIAGPDIMKAMQVGTAIGTARKLQDAVMKEISSPKALQALDDMGRGIIKGNPQLAQGLKLSNDPAFQKGFAIASGIMSGKKVDEVQLLGLRNAMPADAKKGFDAATAYFIGKKDVASKPVAKRNPPPKIIKAGGKLVKVPSKPATIEQSFGYFATHGIVGAGAQQKEVLVKELVASPQMRDGAGDAIRAIAADRKLSPKNRTFWQNMQAWFTARGS